MKNNLKKNPTNSELKFRLYESSVQSSEWQTNNLPRFHRLFTGKTATSMREDFCGTGRISCDWVKKSPKHRAVGLDLDTETLNYAKNINQAALKPNVQERVEFIQQDVRKPTREKFDIIGAHNFSFFMFRERKELLQYAKAAYASLKSGGTFFLEMAGGPGFVKAESEATEVKVPGYGKVKYVWEQHQYDPLRAINDYSIHFQLPDGTWMNDVFTYHWRLWGVRDVREILKEVGFKRSVVLWQLDDDQGEGTSEYRRLEEADDCETWLAYVVGVKE